MMSKTEAKYREALKYVTIMAIFISTMNILFSCTFMKKSLFQHIDIFII